MQRGIVPFCLAFSTISVINLLYHKVMIYDITRTVSAHTKVWPGDTPFSATPVLWLEAGNPVNLFTLTLSPHTGTHSDAYYHFDPNGAFPVDMPLDLYIGPARVVTVAKSNGMILPEDFAQVNLTGTKRLLIHTPVSELADDVWPEEFPSLSVPFIEWCSRLGIALIGIDSPSIDAFDSTKLPCHHALRQANMVNLETLCLRGVPDGEYELIALPLKLAAVCGSPVRAILRTVAK